MYKNKGFKIDISVVIPTYNRYEFLKRALHSVYNQSYIPKEVIVVDDGSTDDTTQIQKDFPHTKYIYQKNSGVSSARNVGVKSSVGEWIAFLDSDDLWHEDKLKEQVLFHEQNPHVKMSYTDELWIRDEKVVKVPKKFRKYGGDIFKECLSHCIIAPSSALLHKSLFDEVGFFDEELEVCEDYDLWLRVAYGHEIGLVDKKLITKYAGHDEQLSFKYWGMDRFRVRALEKLLSILKTNQGKDKASLVNIVATQVLTWAERLKQTRLKPGFQEVKISFETQKPSWSEQHNKTDEIPIGTQDLSWAKSLVRQELLKKYNLLLKGAIKYDKMSDIKKYENRIKFYEQFNKRD